MHRGHGEGGEGEEQQPQQHKWPQKEPTFILSRSQDTSPIPTCLYPLRR